MAIEIPSGFGRDLKRGRQTEVGVWVDGASPFRGETIKGYVQGMHYQYLTDLARRTYGAQPQTGLADLEMRYRYNQDFKSLESMVPAVIPLLLVFIPLMTALGVVREKELGSITNLYVTPVTRLEFLLGKQSAVHCSQHDQLLRSRRAGRGRVQGSPAGSFATLMLGGVAYVIVTTESACRCPRSPVQIGAVAGTAILTMLPTVQFSGLTDPVSSLEGIGATHRAGLARDLFLR